MTVMFKKAERKQAKLRLAITGPSGSGKTYSGLLMASGLGKKIAVIDTENHSASLYVGEKGIPDFDTLEIEAPYTIGKYIDAIEGAVAAGYEVLIIDSITHAWAGEGGLLAQKEALDARGGNSYVNWGAITKDHEKFKSWLLKVDLHLIVTMRSKQDYVLEQNDKGKQTPKKVGLAPIQREGMEYEFTMVLDMAMNHMAGISKTRVNSFDGRIFTPDRKTGEELLAWLNSGATTITVEDGKVLRDLGTAKGITGADFLEFLGVSRLGELTTTQFLEAKKRLEAYQPPVEQKDVDFEIEQLVRDNPGLTFNLVVDYIEGLPYSKELKSVAVHLAKLRAEKTPQQLLAIFKAPAAV